MGKKRNGDDGLTLEVALGLLQEDLRNLQALGMMVQAREFGGDAGPVTVLALHGVVLAQGEDGLRLVLAQGTGTAEDSDAEG